MPAVFDGGFDHPESLQVESAPNNAVVTLPCEGADLQLMDRHCKEGTQDSSSGTAYHVTTSVYLTLHDITAHDETS